MSDNRKFIQAQKFKLAGSGISATDTSIILQSFTTPNSETIAMTDIGTLGWGTLGPGTSREEIISFTGVTQNGDGTATLTGVTRGLDFRAPYTQDTALRKSHAGNEVFILTNNPQMYDSFVNKENDETINGAITFTQVPATNGGNPVNPTDLVRKAYADALVLGALTTLNVITPGTAGETIAAGNLVYLKQADGYWWKCDADTAATVDNILLAIAQGAGTAGNAITDGVLLMGVDDNQSGMTIGTVMYASNTAGAISATPGTTEVTVGTAKSATELYFSPRYNQQLTEDQQDALAGTSGTPSASNKYVTNDDTSATPSGSKAIRWNSGSYPAGDGTAITGVSIKKESYTASGAIAQNDTVYVSAANTVKTLYPSAMGTGTAVTTGASHILGNKCMPLSTNGLYLNIAGGTVNTSGVLYAQVRTINAGETDFSNGTEATIYSTGNGVRGYDVCSIGTDKFLLVFQADTGGSGAGIKAVVITVSGTTVTVGSVVTIESTGSFDSLPACAKADTDKGVIYYRKDSDADLYAQVLTVSTTTITTNTPVLVKVFSSVHKVSACQLATDSNAIIYQDGSGNIFGLTVSISSTTPTINSENTIVASPGGASEGFGLIPVSNTKLFFTYSNNSPVNDTCMNIAVSGSTLTASSTLALGSSRSTRYYGMSAIGSRYLLFMSYSGSNQQTLRFLDVSSTAPTSISTQTLTATTPSDYTASVVKISPWTYMVTGNVSDSDYIVKLTPASSARLGVAESAISDAASGNILYRYTQHANFTGLTTGSFYYIDDTGQPTLNSSLTAPTLGFAISTTKMQLQ